MINKGLGSWFFLAEILISEEFIYDEPVKDMCGTCTRCIDACPTNAIIEDKVVDSNRCISYLTIENKKEVSKDFVKQVGSNIYGCDICQEVCPWNKKFSKITSEKSFYPRSKIIEHTNEDWEKLNEEEFRAIFKKSPAKRTKYIGLKRNINKNL